MIDKEKFALYMQNIEQARLRREKNTSEIIPFSSIEENIKTVEKNINMFSKIARKHKISRNKGALIIECKSIEPVPREILSDILESNVFSEITEELVNSDIQKLSEAKNSGVKIKYNELQTPKKCSHILQRVNKSLENLNMYAHAINHLSNEYRICIKLPENFFNSVDNTEETTEETTEE